LAGVVLLAGFGARADARWMHVASVAVVAQYVADVLDGAVGRERETGLVRWGFYMDRLGDAVFIGVAIAAYMPLYPSSVPVLVGLIIIAGTLFLHEALTCVCTGSYNRYGHHGLGLEEGRLLLILVNTAIAAWQAAWIHWIFVGVLGLLSAMLVEQVIRTQKELWDLDLGGSFEGRDPSGP